jgi:hypothetical protein
MMDLKLRDALKVRGLCGSGSWIVLLVAGDSPQVAAAALSNWYPRFPSSRQAAASNMAPAATIACTKNVARHGAAT